MAQNTGVIGGFNYKRITDAESATLKEGAGVLHTICLNLPVAGGTLTIYDSTTASGDIIAVITEPSGVVPYSLRYDAEFKNGLTVVSTTDAQDITITYV